MDERNALLWTCSTRGSTSQNSSPHPPHSHLAVWSAPGSSAAGSSSSRPSSSSPEKGERESREGERERFREEGDGEGERDEMGDDAPVPGWRADTGPAILDSVRVVGCFGCLDPCLSV